MNSNTICATLSKFDELYSAATAAEGQPSHSSSDIPDGEYAAVIEDIALTHNPPSAPAIVWTFRICGGGYSNRSLRKVRPVTERTVAWVKEDLVKCGLELGAFSDLPNRIEELRGLSVRVAKRTREGNDFGVWILWPNPARAHSAEEIPF